MTRSTFLITLLTLTLTLTALAYWPTHRASAADIPSQPSLKPGTTCKIYFRHDVAGPTSQSYTAGIANNASVSGTVSALQDQWIILDSDHKQYQIPMNAIAMIEVDKAK
jgi:hypothetical protein